jgi:hypothetical protein
MEGFKGNGRSKSAQCFYECLGAPVLLYRSLEDRYSLLDEDEIVSWLLSPPSRLRKSKAAMTAADTTVLNRSRALLDELRRLRRTHARWYYPMDYHVIRSEMPDVFGVFRQEARRRARTGPGGINSAAMQDASGEHHDGKENNGTEEDSCFMEDDAVDWAYYKRISFPLLEESRANLLMASVLGVPGREEDPLDVAQETYRREQVLRSYQRFDRNWVLSDDFGTDAARHLSRLYDQERIDCADPSYMAPFSLESLDQCQQSYKIREDEDALVSPLDDPNGPHFYGNTLLTLPCACQYCSGAASGHITWFLMHPCGPLLDRVSCSCLSFPFSENKEVTNALEPTMEDPLDVDDTIRQLVQCGSTTFLVRTRIHCVIFSAQFCASPSSECSRKASLTVLHRIDLRTLAPDAPYFRPRFVARHPRYGNAWTDPMIAILLEEASSPYQHNVIQVAHSGAASIRQHQHVITNLLDVSQIDFSANHPMVLWSAARPYVCPVIKPTRIAQESSLGFGYSLYSIDLRSNQGTFQWSPSHEDYFVEGTHSISGLYTDWKTEHSVWVASISAGKTWEIDARMPFKALNSWSIPHASDQIDLVYPAVGVFGAGTLFSQPVRDPAVCSTTHGEDHPRPTLSVSLNPGALRIHLYQRPRVRPRFEARSLEASASPGIARQTEVSIAVSSVFALPDVSERIFTCGLASVCVPVSMFLDRESIAKLGYNDDDLRSVHCVFSMTSKGDIYAHNLLESEAKYHRSKDYEGLSLGSFAVAVNDATIDRRKCSRLGNLAVNLSNQYPLPSSALTVSTAIDFRLTGLSLEAKNFPRERYECLTSVESHATSHFVIHKGDSVQQADLPAPLALPFDSFGLQDSIDDRLSKTIDRYDHAGAAVVRKVDEDYRSDVTSTFAEMAAQAWPTL